MISVSSAVVKATLPKYDCLLSPMIMSSWGKQRCCVPELQRRCRPYRYLSCQTRVAVIESRQCERVDELRLELWSLVLNIDISIGKQSRREIANESRANELFAVFTSMRDNYCGSTLNDDHDFSTEFISLLDDFVDYRRSYYNIIIFLYYYTLTT